MTAAPLPVTVLLADPSDVSRFGLRGVLQGDPRFSIVGDVPIDVVGAAQRVQPEIIVLDPAAGGEIDLQIIDELRRVAPNTRLAVLTSRFEPVSFMAAMLRRVHGYFLKDSGGQGGLLLAALALVARFGVVIVDATIAEHFWSYPGTPIAVHVSAPTILTTREVEILTLAIHGDRDKRITDQIQLSIRTVEHHIERVAETLGATNRIQLGWLLHERGLL